MATRLARFTVSGFRNFSRPVTMDFNVVHDYTFNTECIDDGIITKLGIYGPNGSGKSNLGIALFNIVQLLTDKFVDKEVNRAGLFLNRDIKTDVAAFRYEFKEGPDLIVFEYEKNDEITLKREKFCLNDEIIYDYDFTKKAFNVLKRDELIGESLNFEYLDSNLSILRYIANNSSLSDESPFRIVMNFVSHMLWFRSVGQNAFIGLDSSSTILEDWIIRNGMIGDFTRFLNEICDVRVRLDAVSTPDNRKVLVEKHKNGDLIFSAAMSNGTAAAELFYFWMKRFNDVSFLYMDEFDAYYHFSLAGKIIELLKKYKNMQAVFTTHNTSLLSNRILRPDCYFILQDGELKPYIDRANGREIREGHNLEKIYRNGGLNG